MYILILGLILSLVINLWQGSKIKNLRSDNQQLKWKLEAIHKMTGGRNARKKQKKA